MIDSNAPSSLSSRIFVRMHEVIEITGMSRATIYRLIRAGNFPRQRQLSTNVVGWLAREITDWIASRPQVHI